MNVAIDESGAQILAKAVHDSNALSTCFFNAALARVLDLCDKPIGESDRGILTNGAICDVYHICIRKENALRRWSKPRLDLGIA
jgi:hypothetical protein